MDLTLTLKNDLGRDFISDFNRKNPKWRIIPKCFRESHERSGYLYDDPNLGQPYFDFMRYRILGGTAEEIRRYDVQGDIAEAGVFQGFFTVKMHELLPERKMFLYDTFEGFNEKMIEGEEKPNDIKNRNWWADINVVSKNKDLIASIKEKLIRPEQVTFRKGYFPETAEEDKSRRFCLVSLDMDLYQPTLDGLKFFYPRLNPGGYIFIHDGKFEGVQKAIKEFVRDNGMIGMVPIFDQSESYVITKAKE